MDTDDLDNLCQFIFDAPTLSEFTEDISHNENPGNGEDSPEEQAVTNPEFAAKPVVRRRARKACVACHKRKVRCDLLTRGHTCTNCRLDSITCVVRQSGRRTRGSRNKNAAKNDCDAIASTKNVHTTTEDSSQPATTHSSNTGKPHIYYRSNNTSKRRYSMPQNDVQVNAASENDVALPSMGLPHTQDDTLYSYYDFINTEPISHLAPEDLKFLENKGCFHLPSKPLLDELVREYFLHVHPVFPLIDERLFWEAYNPLGPRNSWFKIPLFVFRAMLFVSCSYASDETIQRLGFQKPLDARNCLYQRAQLLYQFNTTCDLITISQGCLILTFYCAEREPMANTSWLRIAIQYANAAGVSDYDHDVLLSTHEKRTRKRLWWCIVLRDRYLPLGVRRSIEIGHEHFDFSQSPLGMSDLEDEFESSQVYDAATKTKLAHIWVAQIDLAVILTDVISLVYPVGGYRSFSRLDYNTMRSILPKLKEYMDNLGKSYAKFQSTCPLHPETRIHESVSLYNGLTRVYFQSARAALCQFALFIIQAEDEDTRSAKIKQLGSALHASITAIADVIKECVQVKMARFLPFSMVAYLALPITLNSLDVNSFSSSINRTEAKRRQLRLLNTAMDIYRGRYSGTVRVQKAITQTVEDTHAEQGNQTLPREESGATLNKRPVNDWLDIFIHRPLEYSRISFRIDMSLSSGYYPEAEALPQRIHFHLDLHSNTPITKSLMAPATETDPDEIMQKLFETSTSEIFGPPIVEDSCLDFLSFNEV